MKAIIFLSIILSILCTTKNFNPLKFQIKEKTLNYLEDKLKTEISEYKNEKIYYRNLNNQNLLSTIRLC